jgi:hypothetical protein
MQSDYFAAWKPKEKITLQDLAYDGIKLKRYLIKNGWITLTEWSN